MNAKMRIAFQKAILALDMALALATPQHTQAQGQSSISTAKNKTEVKSPNITDNDTIVPYDMDGIKYEVLRRSELDTLKEKMRQEIIAAGNKYSTDDEYLESITYYKFLEKGLGEGLLYTNIDIYGEPDADGSYYVIGTRKGYLSSSFGRKSEINLAYQAFTDSINNFVKHHKQIYSRPTKYVSDTLSILDGMKDYLGIASSNNTEVPQGAGAVMFDDKNQINLLHHTLQDKDKAVKLVADSFKISMPEAEKFVLRKYKQWTSGRSIIHEESHSDDAKKGVFIPNLPLKYSIRIRCLTEIKACMEEVASMYPRLMKTGNIDDMDITSFDSRALAVRLLQNKRNGNLDNAEKIIGKYCFKEWIANYKKQHDEKDEGYMSNYWYGAQDVINEDDAISPFLTSGADTEETRKEYLRRVSEMFKDVKGLGDMRDIIDPDFTLSNELEELLSNQANSTLAKITKNSKTVQEAYSRMNEFLETVKSADEDGLHTRGEHKKIMDKFQELKERTGEDKTPLSWDKFLVTERNKEKITPLNKKMIGFTLLNLAKTENIK